MREKGVRLIPIYGRQAFKIDGKFKFWGGLTVESVGGGPGLVNMLTAAAKKRGIEVRYATRGVDLLFDGNRVEGVRVRQDGEVRELRARSVVLACGGFEANPEWRTRYLGPGWDLAKVRGSRYNTGDGIRMALEIGASPRGNWSGCHAVQWEMNAPEFGDLAVGDQFQKHSYPFSIMINATGKRFVDEGADFRNYTYAKYGRVVLEQPGQFAWQIFDQKVKHLQRDEYRIRQITKVTANTIEEFAQKLEGVNAAEFVKTIEEWNAAVRTDVPFNPNVKDGRCTQGLAINKSNWANTHRRAAVRGLRGDLRRHLHVRRLAHQHRRRSAQYRLSADPRPLCGGRTGRRLVLFQLSGRVRPDVRHGVRQDRRHIGRPRRQELTMDAKVKRPLNELSATEIAAKIAAGETTCEAVVRDCIARIAARDGVVKAWVNFDPELALAQARALDAGRGAARCTACRSASRTSIDTFDMPTEMGSPIYRGNRPRADAACVALLRRAGAVHSWQDRDLRIRRQRAAGNDQSAQSRAHAGRLVERIGRGGRRLHGAGRARHPDRRLGAAAVVVLRGFRLQADLQHLQQGAAPGRRPTRSTPSAGSRARSTTSKC